MGENDFDGFVKKIGVIQKSFDVLLAGREAITEVQKIYRFPKRNITNEDRETLAKKIESTINSFLQGKGLKEVRKELREVPTLTSLTLEKIQVLVNRQLMEVQPGGKKKRIITQYGGKETTLGELILSYDPKENRITIDSEKFKDLDSISIRRLEKIFNEEVTQTTETGFLKKPIPVDIIDVDTYRNGDSSRGLEGVIQIIERVCPELRSLNITYNDFSLARNLASTIGFLGEVRAMAICKKLGVSDTFLMATGLLRKKNEGAEKGDEIPIDLLLMQSGFQIKNYSISSQNTVTFSGEQQAPYWIKNRLALTGTLEELLVELFGIYQYNQVTTHPIERWKEYRGYYQSTLDLVPEVANTRIPQMLKIADSFQSDGDSFFGDKKVYYNTFFWINKYLVPASWILGEIIKLVKQISLPSNKSSAVSAGYDFKPPKKNRHRWQILGSIHRNKGLPFDTNFMASYVRVNYHITLDLSSIVNGIYSKL